MSSPQAWTLAQSNRILRIIHAVFGLHMVAVAFIAERVRKPGAAYPQEFEIPFIIIGIGLVAVSFFVRSRLAEAESSLEVNREDRLALGKRQQTYIILFALSEALVLFGFVTRFLGASALYAGPFYAAGIVLLLVSTPRRFD